MKTRGGMRNFHFVRDIVSLLIFVSVSSAFQLKPINFAATKFLKVGDPCRQKSGIPGTCQEIVRCPEVRKSLSKNEVSFLDVACRDTQRGEILLCCPAAGNLETVDISDPDPKKRCGVPWEDHGSSLNLIYYGNDTAQSYKDQGYTIKILDMVKDHVTIFEYSRGNETRTWDILFDGLHFATGGEDARRVLTIYMALLGNDNGWFCDGVLISSQWVLTAAHCFDDISLTIVRLGEYDYSKDTGDDSPIDFSIQYVVTHPDYAFPSAYHDLALVKLTKPVPQLRPDMKPICLPWGEESSVDIEGKTVTLTGWGATIFLGPSHPILQEVNVTVFNPSVCGKSYSTLSDYSIKFPEGITKETSVCAGDEQGGKDACQGDSGGPIVYLDKRGRYTLAGIVSTGNGCGLKEFPGIYVPMHNPRYLSWIKEVVYSNP